jgi:subtilisin family serine protease
MQMLRKFIVLRDLSPPAERATRSSRGIAIDPQAIEIRSEAHAPGASDLSDDDEVLGYCPAVKLKLVRPLSVEANGSAHDSLTWGLRAVHADQSRLNGNGVTVAVLDTGIAPGHPAFAHVAKLVQQDFTGEGDGDGNGHGTHCAGTIFGGTVNGTRIGIAPGIRAAYIGKVLDREGAGSSDQLIEGLMWAVRNRAQVIAMSLGIDFPGHVQELVERHGLPTALATSQALDDFRRTLLMFEEVAGVINSRVPNGVVIAAAGNESQRKKQADFRIGVSLPAATRGFISVGALGETGDGLAIADFSNTGPVLSAPGVDITSAWLDGGLATMSGTSMAAPHVAGVAALCAQKLKEDRFGGELRATLVTSVTRQGLKPGIDPRDVGAGLVVAP